MGRLSGFKYREVARRLRLHGYVFDRQGPGSHEIWVAYSDPPDYSKFKLPLKVDAKAGENYEVQANFKVHFKGGNNWNPVIVPFAPDADHFQARTECRF